VTAAPDIAIDVEGLTKSFGGRTVVRNLSMRVKRGTIYGFLGPNGSGKTTTIRMLCGLLTPDQGRGTCLGFDIITQSDQIKHYVGYMTQRFSLYQDLSVRENLEFVARLYGLPDPVAAARAMIERIGLGGRERQLAGERRSQGAARVLERDSRVGRRGPHCAGLDPLHGRGGALP
jgi:ABC-2 type transport system ATP-binding protein